jgi:hypothetical protein
MVLSWPLAWVNSTGIDSSVFRMLNYAKYHPGRVSRLISLSVYENIVKLDPDLAEPKATDGLADLTRSNV